MAELLKSGATMLQQTCPECGTPLFRKGRETFCPKCNRPVVIIESAADEGRLVTGQILDDTERTLLNKIREINSGIKAESDPERLVVYGNALNTWLSAIERLRSLKAQTVQ